MSKLQKILFAEDSENDIELTLAAFAESQLANPIEVVRDGEEALDYLFCKGRFEDREDEPPIFVLLDLKMPKKDGIEVLKVIRDSEKFRNLPVIILTSSQMETDVVRSYELGVNGFVVKPIDFMEFVKAIKAIGFFWAILNTSPMKQL